MASPTPPEIMAKLDALPDGGRFIFQFSAAIAAIAQQMVLTSVWKELRPYKELLSEPPEDPEEWSKFKESFLDTAGQVLDRLLQTNPWGKPLIRAYLVDCFKEISHRPPAVKDFRDDLANVVQVSDIGRLFGIDFYALTEKYEALLSGQIDLPPEPPKGPHGKHTVKKIKFTATMDPELYRLFDEQRSKLRFSHSAMLDTVVWHFFGRPKLSFEQDHTDEEQSGAER